MKLNYAQEAFILPTSVLSHLSDAQDAWIRILLWIASDPTLCNKPKQLAKLADTDSKTVKTALHYWEEAGVLTDAEDPAVAESDRSVRSPRTEEKGSEKKQILRRADTLPQYTSVELGDLLEQRASVRALVDESQRILGKMFHPAEINLLVGMLDYLEMSEECILLLLAHCKRIGKTNLRSIEKYACNLADKGILDATAMEEELRTLEALHSFEGEIRTMFGIKSRAFTGKESQMLRAWMSYGYSADIVRRAFEMTVNATGEASIPYTNAILQRWNTEGLRTAEQIDAELRQAQSQKSHSAAAALGGSFDIDDFFEAALRRGLAEKE